MTRNGKRSSIHRISFTSATFLIATLCLSVILSGCGDSSEKGSVFIGLTDAEGDFLTYAVDVVSIKLTKANGAVVETLPLTARIDFTQYTDLTEFIAAATIPSGTYTQASMILDYSDADIQVDVGGVATPAVVQDRDGNPVSQLVVNVRLDDQRHLVILPGVPAHLTLDFELDSSNEVDTSVTPPVVTVEPFLLADVNPEESQIHRARGPLVAVDETNETFDISIRPFNVLSGNFGRLHVVPDSSTVYEVNGASESGSAGFALLAQQTLLTAVIVYGELDITDRIFRATEVDAGSSVPGGTLDAVRGSIVARDGDLLTVRGATLIRSDGTVVLNSDVDVTVGPGTRVRKQGTVDDALSTDDLSVGQLVTAFGTLTDTQPSSLALNTTAGHVRMHVTSISGTVNAVSAGEIVMDLQHINGRPISLFDFSGTGSDPDAYHSSTGSLSLSAVSAGDPVRVLGFVAPFDSTKPPDFEAQTVIDAASVTALMLVSWFPPAAAPFSAASDTGLTLDLSGAGLFHHVLRSGITTTIATSSSPQVLPKSGGRGLFGIRQNGTVTIHTDFSDFVDDLTGRLNDTRKMTSLLAQGSYAANSQSLTARSVSVALR